MSFMTMSCSRG